MVDPVWNVLVMFAGHSFGEAFFSHTAWLPCHLLLMLTNNCSSYFFLPIFTLGHVSGSTETVSAIHLANALAFAIGSFTRFSVCRSVSVVFDGFVFPFACHPGFVGPSVRRFVGPSVRPQWDGHFHPNLPFVYYIYFVTFSVLVASRSTFHLFFRVSLCRYHLHHTLSAEDRDCGTEMAYSRTP